jgi:PKD repeat protein
MKKLYLLILLIPVLFFKSNFSALAQCTPNITSYVPGIYPEVLPDATVNQAYNEDITFVFFKDTVVSGLKFDALKVVLHSINGLPIGLNWQSNKSNNEWDPQTETAGCVNISGTPIAAGTYFVVASATITLSSIAGDQPYLDTFELKVLPASSSNIAFSMTNSVGCAPLAASFTNGTPGNNTYGWSFGDNSANSSDENPTHIYQNAGTYVVTQTVTPNAVPEYYLTDLTINSVPDDDFWENAFDIYFIIYDGSQKVVFQGYDEKNNPSDESYLIRDAVLPQKWTLPNLKLNAETYTIEVWDLDDWDGTLNTDADENLGSITFFGNSSSGSASSAEKGGTLSLDYNIYVTSVTTTSTTDTITVYPAITSASISTIGDTVFCDGNSVVLISSLSTGNQWYKDGGALIGDTNQTYTVTESGSYHLKITNAYGCYAEASPIQVTVYSNPPTPNFWNDNGTLYTSLYGYNLQWYLNGSAISGATSTSYTLTQSGLYSLVATNQYGCTSESQSVFYTYSDPGSSIKETSNIQNLNIYPNPTDGDFTLSFYMQKKESIEISIENILGQALVKDNFNNVQGSFNKLYNIKNLPKGVYLVNVKDSNKGSIANRIVLQ